uniref:Uncharacterized protein n=1 Tax=Terrapene triunguis TaxID=2587831 RepID=A0A674JY75_9SAUR
MELGRHGGIDTLVSNVAVNPFFGSTLHTSEDVGTSLVVTHMEKGVRVWGEHMGGRGHEGAPGLSSLAHSLSLCRGSGLAVLILPPPPQVLGLYSVSKTVLPGLTKALIKFSSAMSLWKDEAVKEKMLKNLRVKS